MGYVLPVIAILGGMLAQLCGVRAAFWYERRTGRPGMGWWVGILVGFVCVLPTIALLCFLVLGLHLTIT